MERFQTDRLVFEPITVEHAPNIHAFYLENRKHLEPWEPKRDEMFYRLDTHIQNCESAEESFRKGIGYGFIVKLKETDEFIGRVNLNNVVRGVFHNAYIGYFMAQKYNGKGYMTEAVKKVVEHACYELKLHRIQAAVIPTNYGSIRVVEKAGFRKEGLALRYLKINGEWKDHLLYAITEEDL